MRPYGLICMGGGFTTHGPESGMWATAARRRDRYKFAISTVPLEARNGWASLQLTLGRQAPCDFPLSFQVQALIDGARATKAVCAVYLVHNRSAQLMSAHVAQ